ncbi:MAG: bacteriohemerythrin, partial [Leptospiraceae bacterium]|nr:bacteriohemerythrin [Leptospiraceae bacterium]
TNKENHRNQKLNRQIQREKKVFKAKLNRIVNRFIPEEIFGILKKENIFDIEKGDQIASEMTILFCDIRSFTSLTERNSAKDVFTFLNEYYSNMNDIILKHNGIIDKYIGDAILSIFPGSADDAVKAAIDMQKFMHSHFFKIGNDQIHVSIGIGIHSGAVILGVVGGEKLIQTTVISDVVNTASRLESLTKEYKAPIIISEDVLANLEEQETYHIRFLDFATIRGKEDVTYICEIYDFENEEQLILKDFSKGSFDNGVTIYQNGDYQKSWEIFLDILTLNPKDKPASYYLNKTASLLVTGDSSQMIREDYVQWNDDWRTGIELVDYQHKILFEIVNELEKAIFFQREREVLKKIFHNLKVYTITHFSLEEAFMFRASYPDFEEHKYQHKLFIEEINKGEKSLQEADISSSNEILKFLCDWLTIHIQKSDRDGYAPFLFSTNQVPEYSETDKYI